MYIYIYIYIINLQASDRPRRVTRSANNKFSLHKAIPWEATPAAAANNQFSLYKTIPWEATPAASASYSVNY